ncbi:MAG TPA: hypothetical protein GXZ91_04385 [Christensenellaceae bacterium]|jgi:hypothetical protein|nr:hypothetical protein [Christensenellaceae bacterium]
MAISVARRTDNPTNFVNGFAKKEWLEGVHPLVKSYKCILKAGSSIEHEVYEDKIVVLMFGFGTGYITDEKKAYNIDDIAFYIPDFGKKYSVYAVTDLEYMLVEVDMPESDMKAFEDTHVILPYFIRVKDAIEYTQTCKGPNTRSWSMIHSGQCARVLAGIVKAEGEGTDEKGHAQVHQWNFTLPGSDFKLVVGDESIHHGEGEWSFVPAGIDHSLTAEQGKVVHYVWFEIKTGELKI